VNVRPDFDSEVPKGRRDRFGVIRMRFSDGTRLAGFVSDDPIRDDQAPSMTSEAVSVANDPSLHGREGT